MNGLRIPRQRTAALWPWAEGLCAWFRRTSLQVHEQQLVQLIAQLQLDGDLDGCVHTLPRLQARLVQVQQDLATDPGLHDRPTSGVYHAANDARYAAHTPHPTQETA